MRRLPHKVDSGCEGCGRVADAEQMVRTPPSAPHLTPAERAAQGKAARSWAPRSSQRSLEVADDRDALGLLESQAQSRLAELVPIRYGRMLASPFAFLRGAAAVMAHDLARTPVSGLSVQLAGDAHLLNFGGFASPERDLVFDLNDFDETLSGPFEWDVKRLATSFEVAGRDRNFAHVDRSRAVLETVRTYREALSKFAAMGDMDVWYARLDANGIDEQLRAARDRRLERSLRRSEAKGYAHDRMGALAKLTHVVDGEPRIISDPPLLVPLAELAERQNGSPLESLLRELFDRYRRTLSGDRRKLLERFRYADLARKVVGIGSVGTRCWLLLMVGRDERDPLFLQIKEAQQSVLEPFLRRSPFATHGQRVVEGQRLMQASSDILLGWVHSDEEVDGGAHDFYLRQLWDWKTSVEIKTITPRGLTAYAAACGWTLARAHARSGDRIAIAAYLGTNDSFDRAVADFAATYADINEQDHHELAKAVANGRLTAIEGI
jgi:uncharacterized protein (DUF2252 family)